MKAGPDSLPGENSSVNESLPVVRAVCLVGFMGAGKSSVGAALSRQLGWPFVDLDERIQSREGRTIEEIFRQSGEAGFRREEQAALRDLLRDFASSSVVIALGGGAFVQAENAALLKRSGIPTVFLDAPVEELFRRCQEQQLDRPLRRDQEQFRQLHEVRRAGYLGAGMRIETSGKDVDTVAAEVARSLKSRGAVK
jgi:shikimate kinase